MDGSLWVEQLKQWLAASELAARRALAPISPAAPYPLPASREIRESHLCTHHIYLSR